MKHRAAILSATAILAMVSVTGCFSQRASNQSGTQKSSGSEHATNATWSSTRSVSIQDPGLGMAAYTLAVPSGWKYAGMILRPGGCHPPPVPASGLSYIEQSPDGLTAFAQLPGVSWTWTSNGSAMNPKCPANMNLTTAAGLLLNIGVPNLHPNATSVAVVPLRKVDQDAINANNARLANQTQTFGRQFQDAARVVVTYDLNGVTVEENMTTMIDCTESKGMAMPGGPGRGQIPGFMRRNCSSRGTFITRAPKGYLDAAMKTRMFPQIDSAWDNQVISNMRAIGQRMIDASNAQFAANQKYFAQQNAQMMQHGRDVQAQIKNGTDHAMAADRDRQNAIDNSAHQTALYVLDKQSFVNPSTGQRIEASSQYNHQWMSSDGSTLIQTQDHTLDPNGVVYPVSQSWTELVPTN